MTTPLVIERAYQRQDPAYGWIYQLVTHEDDPRIHAPSWRAPLSDGDIAALVHEYGAIACAFCQPKRDHWIASVDDAEQCATFETSTFYSDGWASQ